MRNRSHTVTISDDLYSRLEAAARRRGLCNVEQLLETLLETNDDASRLQTTRPLPTGMGRYHSGRIDVSEQVRDLLREAVKDKLWP